MLIETLARAAEDVTGITAVSSRVTKDYARVKLPDGSYQPETYAFGEGGNWGGEIKDATIDNLKFLDVARVISAPLAAQKFIPTRDPNKTKLLIMVYWGTTAVPMPYDQDPIYQEFQQDIQEYRTLLDSQHPDEADAVYNAGLVQLAMANRIRDRLDFKNAAMLGYLWSMQANRFLFVAAHAPEAQVLRDSGWGYGVHPFGARAMDPYQNMRDMLERSHVDTRMAKLFGVYMKYRSERTH